MEELISYSCVAIITACVTMYAVYQYEKKKGLETDKAIEKITAGEYYGSEEWQKKFELYQQRDFFQKGDETPLKQILRSLVPANRRLSEKSITACFIGAAAGVFLAISLKTSLFCVPPLMLFCAFVGYRLFMAFKRLGDIITSSAYMEWQENMYRGDDGHLNPKEIERAYKKGRYIQNRNSFFCFGDGIIIFGDQTGIMAVTSDSLLDVSRVAGKRRIYDRSVAGLSSWKKFYDIGRLSFSIDLHLSVTDAKSSPLPADWKGLIDKSSGTGTINLEFNEFQVEMIMAEFCRRKKLSYEDSLKKIEVRNFDKD